MEVDLQLGIVRILKSNRETAGTGFVVTKEGLIATCAHVVKDAGSGPGKTVRLVFHATKEEGVATVEPEFWREPEAEDVAILSLNNPMPNGLKYLRLASSPGSDNNHPFKTFGFPPAKPVEGMGSTGIIIDRTTENSFPVLQLQAPEVTNGFSGAPVLDIGKQRVVGMIVSVVKPDKDTSFIIPTETLKQVCRILKPEDLCPYRGLDAFKKEDYEFFFGRERVVKRLLDKLEGEPPLLAVLGPSGSGKSSLVQAGLIHQLRQGRIPHSDHWEEIVNSHYGQPFERLVERGLEEAKEGLVHAKKAWLDQHPEKERLVLVLDQFEQLFLECPAPLQQEFLEQLTDLLENSLDVTVALIMRDDFYSRLAQQASGLWEKEWLPDGIVQVPGELNGDELINIVQEPARKVGLEFESGLLDDIVKDALETASSETEERVGHSTILPLLEFALTELWKEDHEKGVLTHESYDVIGGVTGGLRKWANRAYWSLGEELRPLARRILTDLVYLGDESEGIPDNRRRRSVGELYRNTGEREIVQQVVRHLTNARLLVTTGETSSGQNSVQIIHDALLGEWDILRQWLQKNRPFLVWHQEIERRTRLWKETSPHERSQRDEGRLLHGGDLSEAAGWLREHGEELGEEERKFIEASRESQVREQQRWKQLAEREAQHRQEAERQRDEAERQRRIAFARQLAAQAEILRNQSPRYLPLSILLAVESMKRSPSLQADQILRHGLGLLARPVFRVHHGSSVNSVVFSPQGEYLATASRDGTARVVEVPTGEEVARVHHGSRVDSIEFNPQGDILVFSPQGEYLATAGAEDGTVRVVEVSTGEEVARVHHGSRVNSVAFSPQGEYLATASHDGSVRVEEVSTGEEVAWRHHEGEVNSVVFSPQGEYLATASHDFGTTLAGSVRVEEVSTGKEVEWQHHERGVNRIVFSPQGKYLATASHDNTTTVVEVSTREEVAGVHTEGPVYILAFSPQGEYLATAGAEDDMVRVVEVSTGEEIAQVRHGNTVNSVAFSPQGEYLATAGSVPENTVRVVEVSTGEEVAWVHHDGEVNSVAFSPQGEYLATASDDGTATVVEFPTGEEVARVHHGFLDTPSQHAHSKRHEITLHYFQDGVGRLIFSPQGEYLATASDGETASVVQVPTGEEFARAHYGAYANSVAFSPQGEYLATASDHGTATVVEVSTGEEVARVHPEGDSGVDSVVFSPQGEYLATASRDGTVRVVEVPTGEEVARVHHDSYVGYGSWVNSVVFSPQGEYLATASRDGTARVVEVPTGEEVARVHHDGEVNSVAFSPQGEYLATASDDGTATVVEVSTGEEVARVHPEGDSGVDSVVFSPQGEYLATASRDGTTRVVEVSTGEEVARVHPEGDSGVGRLIFSPQGKYLATASDGETASVVEVSTGEEVARVHHDGEVNSVAFSPQGEYLATASRDGTTRVVEVSTGEEVARVHAEGDSGVDSVVFGPQGKYLATASHDGTVRVWYWRPEDLIEEACERLIRNLTQEEWQAYLGEEPYRKTCPNLP